MRESCFVEHDTKLTPNGNAFPGQLYVWKMRNKGALTTRLGQLLRFRFIWHEKFLHLSSSQLKSAHLPSSKWEAPSRKHQAPSSKQQSASTEHQAPSTEHQAPSRKHQAQSTKDQAPSSKHQAPSTKHQAASSKQQASGEGRAESWGLLAGAQSWTQPSLGPVPLSLRPQ